MKMLLLFPVSFDLDFSFLIFPLSTNGHLIIHNVITIIKHADRTINFAEDVCTEEKKSYFLENWFIDCNEFFITCGDNLATSTGKEKQLLAHSSGFFKSL